MRWQEQDAKQRFSELIRTTQADGPQVVTRRGEEIAVVIDIADYRYLKGETAEFKNYLRSGPDYDGLDLPRPRRASPDPRLGRWDMTFLLDTKCHL
jgi:prevent-host-death family protein